MKGSKSRTFKVAADMVLEAEEWLERGRYLASQTLFEFAAELYMDHPRADGTIRCMIGLGKAKEKLGDRAGAEAMYLGLLKLIIESGPSCPRGLLGDILLRISRVQSDPVETNQYLSFAVDAYSAALEEDNALHPPEYYQRRIQIGKSLLSKRQTAIA
jgi:hypothetical protein